MLEVLDYLIRPSIYRTRLTHCVSIKSLVLGLIGLKLSRFQVPKFLAECFIIMYVVCLLFYAIGGFLFVTMFVLNRPNAVDTFSSLTSRRGTIILSFQNMFAFHILQYGHLLDGYLVEFLETFALRQTFVDKDRIEVLHITPTNRLVNRRVDAYISFNL